MNTSQIKFLHLNQGKGEEVLDHGDLDDPLNYLIENKSLRLDEQEIQIIEKDLDFIEISL